MEGTEQGSLEHHQRRATTVTMATRAPLSTDSERLAQASLGHSHQPDGHPSLPCPQHSLSLNRKATVELWEPLTWDSHLPCGHHHWGLPHAEPGRASAARP